jgi:enterochelin esterase-like enzyme
MKDYMPVTYSMTSRPRWLSASCVVLASCSLGLTSCASDADNSPSSPSASAGSSGAGGAAAVPSSGGGDTGPSEPGVVGAGTSAGGGGGGAPPTSGGTGGTPSAMAGGGGGGLGGNGSSGGTGGAAVGPELDALLREGIGDTVRPPPYEYGPYSKKRDDVPHGTVKQFSYQDETFWPDAPARGVKVFEPAQYAAGKEVALAVFCDGTASWAYLTDAADGGSYRTRHVLDNLIAEELIPPFIGVFIGNDGDGGNRQTEYGPLTDKNVRFFVEGVLPEVSRRYGYKFTSNPNLRAVIGESSGGIAAFTAAWQRPDWFRLVMSHSGSFVNLGNGGDRYPDIIRMTEEVKPLRLHLEGGRKDSNGGGKQHPAMAAALKAKGYAYQWLDTTEGTHGGLNGNTTFPEGLIWLWKGWQYR